MLFLYCLIQFRKGTEEAAVLWAASLLNWMLFLGRDSREVDEFAALRLPNQEEGK
jgi:hypothetical protein